MLFLFWKQRVTIVCLFHFSTHGFPLRIDPHQLATSYADFSKVSLRRKASRLTSSSAAGCFGHDDDSSALPHLNIIIPAYNEETRIIQTLESYTSYLESNWPSYTITVIDDGSVDSCSNVVKGFATKVATVRCITLSENLGKGAAIAAGIASILVDQAPQIVLTADADGSADLSSVGELYGALERMVQKQWGIPAIVAGYRTYDERAMGRLVFRWGFRTTVRIICGDLGCSDTQCGFKLMTLPAASSLYSSLHLRRWSHDVEVLMRASYLGVQVAEAPVRWIDQQGSKLVSEGIIKVTVQMFVDVVRCRLAYWLGLWSVEQ